MKISTFFYTLRQGFRSLFRNKWYTLASAATIAACLFLFGIIYAVLANFQHIVKNAEEIVCVTVFFHNEMDGVEVSDARIAEIGDMINARNEVDRDRTVFTTAEQAWEEFKVELDGGELLEGFAENPLANCANYRIYLKDVSLQSSLVTYLESIPEIRRINKSELAASTLSGVNLIIAYVSVGIIAILLAVSIFLISNTVTMGISVRQEEINIMKYIGATDFFVRAPFVIEGVLIGLIGASIPLGLIYSLYSKVLVYAEEAFPMLVEILEFLPADAIFNILTPVSLAIGVGIGFVGSFSTVRKHLHV